MPCGFRHQPTLVRMRIEVTLFVNPHFSQSTLQPSSRHPTCSQEALLKAEAKILTFFRFQSVSTGSPISHDLLASRFFHRIPLITPLNIQSIMLRPATICTWHSIWGASRCRFSSLIRDPVLIKAMFSCVPEYDVLAVSATNITPTASVSTPAFVIVTIVHV